MAQAGVKPSDLVAVAVALGPGSFAGLRVALAAGKGLALANDLRLLGVPTLDAVAYPHQSQPLSVVALVQAGRGRVGWASYVHGPAGWGAQEPCRLSTVAEMAATILQPTVFVGELLPADRETLLRLLGQPWVHFLPSALTMRRAGYLAELAWQRFASGEADDPATLSPIYLS
jgi:tRNA threonylcarbamoyladenosine biosynthesis protein TsaB